MSAGVSVVIPVFNGAAYLAEAVASVQTQTVEPLEIVVVDDGSTDDTSEVIGSLDPPVQAISQANAGPGAAMNRGVEAASGTHVAFISADDLWAADKLERQLAALERDHDLDMVFGHVQHFISPDLDTETAARLRCPPDPMPANSAGTMLTRLETFRRVGPFNPEFRVGEFFDWYGRASDLGLRSHVLSEVVSHRRVHKANHSQLSRAPQEGYAQVLKAIVDRRRAAGTDRPEGGESS